MRRENDTFLCFFNCYFVLPSDERSWFKQVFLFFFFVLLSILFADFSGIRAQVKPSGYCLKQRGNRSAK